MTAFGVITCPDCNRATVDGRLTHDDTCPLGLGIDEITDDDRAWFERRPDATTRRRPVHWTEAAELRVLGAFPPVGEIVGDVLVTQIAPGVRMRSMAELWLLIGGGV